MFLAKEPNSPDPALQRSKAGFCISKKNLKNVGFLLDKSKVGFNIIKDGLRFFKIILCKDSEYRKIG